MVAGWLWHGQYVAAKPASIDIQCTVLGVTSAVIASGHTAFIGLHAPAGMMGFFLRYTVPSEGRAHGLWVARAITTSLLLVCRLYQLRASTEFAASAALYGRLWGYHCICSDLYSTERSGAWQ